MRNWVGNVFPVFFLSLSSNKSKSFEYFFRAKMTAMQKIEVIWPTSTRVKRVTIPNVVLTSLCARFFFLYLRKSWRQLSSLNFLLYNTSEKQLDRCDFRFPFSPQSWERTGMQLYKVSWTVRSPINLTPEKRVVKPTEKLMGRDRSSPEVKKVSLRMSHIST